MEYLKKQYPEFPDEKVEKEIVFSSLYPNTKYNDGTVRFLMFTLMDLALDYLTHIQLRQNKLLESNYLLKALNQKALYKQFERSSRDTASKFNKVIVHTEEYYYDKHFFEYENLYYLHRFHFDRNEKFVQNKSVNNIINNLNYFYTARMLRFYLYILNTGKLYNIQIKTRHIDEVINNFDSGNYTDTPLITLLYNTIMLHLKEDDEEYFHIVKNELIKNFDKTDLPDAAEIIINLENYCKRMVRKGKRKYTSELFNLFKFEIEHKTYVYEGGFSEKLYFNVIETAIKMNELDWTEKFIEKFKKELYSEVRDSSYCYGRALYEFASGNFERAIELLSKAKYKEVYNKFEIKTLLICCFYELDMIDPMYSAIDSYRHLLASDKYISPDRKKYYSNFLKIAKKMIQLKLSYSLSTLFTLRKMLEMPDVVINNDWIEAKLLEAEKKNPLLKRGK